MRVGSLFTGIGGLDLGLERAGLEVAWQCEIDDYCDEVLERHWPSVRRFRDVRDVGVSRESTSGNVHAGNNGTEHGRGEARAGLSSGPDLICGGFPCQDVSVAGRRAGLDGDRSGLWFEFERVVSELSPRYVLVENVLGLLSSNQGRDFARIIDGLGQLGYGVSWTVLDSQHFGVPQRRRRVFIVAGPPDGRTEAILAIAEGCAGHPETGRAAGQDAAAAVGDGVAKPLGSHDGWSGYRQDLDNETYVPSLTGGGADSPQSGRVWDENGASPTLDLAVVPAVAVRIAHTLSAEGADASEDGSGRGTPLAYAEIAGPVVSSYAKSGDVGDGSGNAGRFVGQSVRRLTPLECARLQGFPDDWLHGSDAKQYRALGNAVTVPVAEWIGKRIMAVEREL